MKEKGKLIYSFSLKYGKIASILLVIMCALVEFMGLRYLIHAIRTQSYIELIFVIVAMAIIIFFMLLGIMGYKWMSFEIYENGIINPLPIGKSFRDNPFKKGIFYHFDNIADLYTRPLPKYTLLIIKTLEEKHSVIGFKNEEAEKILQVALESQKTYHENKKNLKHIATNLPSSEPHAPSR